MAATTPAQALAQAAQGGALAFFYHLPFSGLGRIIREGVAFSWEAV